MRTLYTDGHDDADHWLIMFANCGYWLTPGTKILDYGCGTGQMVYRLRDLGFEAYGFDIHTAVDYRAPEDREFFGFVKNPEQDRSNTVIQPDLMHIPFPDNMFEVVVSTSVIEHVMDLSVAMSEIARVLKADGVSLHQYPKRSMIIEPHMFVPLATRVQNWWWFYFWALLGVRNEFQINMPARQVADSDTRYSHTGVRYLTEPQIFEVCDRYFESVRFVDDRAASKHNPMGRWLAALRSENRMCALSNTQSPSWLLTAKKRTEVRSSIDMRFKKWVVRYLARQRRFIKTLFSALREV